MQGSSEPADPEDFPNRGPGRLVCRPWPLYVKSIDRPESHVSCSGLSCLHCLENELDFILRIVQNMLRWILRFPAQLLTTVGSIGRPMIVKDFKDRDRRDLEDLLPADPDFDGILGSTQDTGHLFQCTVISLCHARLLDDASLRHGVGNGTVKVVPGDAAG